MNIEEIEIDKLIPYHNNPRKNQAVDKVASSIKEYGFQQPIVVDKNMVVIVGHTRLMGAKKLGLDKVPTIIADLSETQAKAYRIADNRINEESNWDNDLLNLEINNLLEENFNIENLGFDENEINKILNEESYAEGVKGQMSSTFGVPPFTVLNAREGNWQERKKYWYSLGIKSELGRDENLISYSKVSTLGGKDTSIFDPVLCELMYNWFSPKDGLILDPFAGGSVRGILASKCQRQYIGNDLSEKQVLANREQAENICENEKYIPTWTIGDSVNLESLVGDIKADAILSCPPYINLEVYSNKNNDLSNMNYNEFLKNYSLIIKQCYNLLKENSFVIWVIGEVRDKKGNYYNFLGDTIKSFKDAGFHYYNEAVLVTAIGSLPLRAGRAMKTARKLGKTHQNILIFLKGDAKKATAKCGEININLDNEEIIL